MDLYFNKTINNLQRNIFEDPNNNKANSPYLNNKTITKSKSSNELTTNRKNDKEALGTNTFISAWGFNKQGQLANSNTTLKACIPNTIKNLGEPPVTVSAGENHTAIITQKLKLYVSGANNFGQLGIEDLPGTNKPTLVPSLSYHEIVHVACGSDHTFALTSKGEVYAWGSNFKGQLGLGDFEHRPIPTLVVGLTPYGQTNSKTIKRNGSNNALHKRNKSSNNLSGSNQKDNLREKSLSVDFNNDPSMLPGDKGEDAKLLLQDDEKVIDIACGALHTLVKTDKQRMFACGFGETYALGHGDTKSLPEFKLVTFPKTTSTRASYGKGEEIDRISCGLAHSGCIKNGKIYLWGLYSNKIANVLKVPTQIDIIQADNPFDIAMKKKIDDNYFVDIKLGDALSVFLNSKGEVFTMGENIEGQLGISNVSTTDLPQKVINLPIAVTHIAAGRNHVFAMSSDIRQIYGWGSNSLGQLGFKNKGQNILTPRLLNYVNDFDPFRIVCGSFHSLCISYKPIVSNETEENEFSDEENNKSGNLSTTVDLQKCQDEIEKLKIELDKMKNKNYRTTVENEKLKVEVSSLQAKNMENTQKSAKRSQLDQNTQTIDSKEEAKKNTASGVDLELKMKNKKGYDKSPELKPQRVLHPQLEIDFKELILEKQISEGGYGVIYRGRWRESVVAVKMLKIDMKEEHVRDFIYECYAMESLRHPNIVMFLGACTKPPNLAIVLEFCTRGSLWSVLQNQEIPLSWDDRKRIALDAARGVTYLHAFNPPVLHRDLKSLNLLLDDGFRTKVADFGWTRTMASTMTGKIGTYQWMAPEVISGHNYTEKADVFSFGIILWEIAAREPPYRNISGLQVSIEVVNNDLRPTIPKKTPENFAKLVRKCWDREPSKRPSFKEIIKELEAMKFTQ
jgi:mitogen-activated protein kinase kinase kinase 9